MIWLFLCIVVVFNTEKWGFVHVENAEERKNVFRGANLQGQGGDGTCRVANELVPIGKGSILNFNYSSEIVRVYAGNLHSFLITKDNQVYGFGSNNHFVLGAENQYTQKNTYIIPHNLREIGIFRIKDKDSLSSVNRHTIVIDENGNAMSFGEALYGKLGGGEFKKDQAVPVFMMDRIKSAKTSVCSSLLLNETGHVFSCGCDRGGLIGIDSDKSQNRPVLVEGLPEIEDIYPGEYSSHFLDMEGSWWYAGTIWYSKDGHNKNYTTTPKKFVDKSKYGKIKLFAAGFEHFLFLAEKDGEEKLYSVGLNSYGCLGNGKLGLFTGVQEVDMSVLDPGEKIVKLIATQYSSGAITNRETNNILLWGKPLNLEGPGVKESESILIPSRVDGASDYFFTDFSISPSHVLALTNDSLILSMGSNLYGQSGRTDIVYVDKLEPCISDIYKKYDQSLTKISCGSRTCFGIMNSGRIYSWGKGEYGQLGIWSTEDRLIPSEIMLKDCTVASECTDADFELGVHIGSSEFFSVALSLQGNVFSYGNGLEGEIGMGDGFSGSDFPVKIDLGEDVHIGKICVGYFHTLLLTRDYIGDIGGDLLGFGKGTVGELGLGSGIDNIIKTSPEFILSDVHDISCRYRFNVALLRNTSLVFWGTLDVNVVGRFYHQFSPIVLTFEEWEGHSIEKFDTGFDYFVVLTINESSGSYLWKINGTTGESPILLKFYEKEKQVIQMSSWKHTLVLFKDGTIQGFGHNKYSEIDISGVQYYEYPVDVNVGFSVSRVMTSSGMSFFQSDVECFGIQDSDQKNVCSGFGFCLDTDKCYCYPGRGGRECEEIACGPPEFMGVYKTNEENPCSGHGECQEGNICKCAHSKGEYCETPLCSPDCENDGTCIWNSENKKPVCMCTKDYTGDYCEKSYFSTTVLPTLIISCCAGVLFLSLVLCCCFCCCTFCTCLIGNVVQIYYSVRSIKIFKFCWERKAVPGTECRTCGMEIPENIEEIRKLGEGNGFKLFEKHIGQNEKNAATEEKEENILRKHNYESISD